MIEVMEAKIAHAKANRLLFPLGASTSVVTTPFSISEELIVFAMIARQ